MQPSVPSKSTTLCISFYGWNKADLFIDALRRVGFRVIGHLVFRKKYPSSTRFLRYQHERTYVLAKGSDIHAPMRPPCWAPRRVKPDRAVVSKFMAGEYRGIRSILFLKQCGVRQVPAGFVTRVDQHTVEMRRMIGGTIEMGAVPAPGRRKTNPRFGL